MASGQWQIANFPAANAAATAAVTAGVTGGQAIRCRSVQVSISGTAAGAATIVVRDGATGVGAIIWQTQINCAANAGTMFSADNMDLRATTGTLTIESTGAGGANTNIAVNAQGDLVPVGYPAFGP